MYLVARPLSYLAFAFVLLFALQPAGAQDRVALSLPPEAAGLEADLRGASRLIAAEAAGDVDGQTLFAAASADYANLLSVLYARGYYSGVIRISLDGREAAGIAVLDAPEEVRAVRIAVDPGPQFRFSRAVVRPLAGETVLPAGFAAGSVAESGLILEATTAGIDGWRAAGHAKARVVSEAVTADHRANGLSAEVVLAPGPKLRFGTLRFQGQDRMSEERLQAIAGFPTGKVFDPEELERVSRRLRKAGVFASVVVSEDEGIAAPDRLNATARVAEEKLRHYGLSAEMATTTGLTVTGSWFHRNLRRGAERLTLSGEAWNLGEDTGGIDYAVGLAFERPATFSPDTGFKAEWRYTRLAEPDYLLGGTTLSMSLTHEVSREMQLKAGFDYSIQRFTDSSGSYAFRALALPLSLEWDRRDVKNDARRGFFLKAEAKPFRGFDLTDSGLRLQLDLRGYRALDQGGRFVLAGRLQGGAILGASLAGAPPDYLFRSGGGGTVRGQPYQSLQGQSGLASGGLRFLAASFEARVRVSESLGVVGFVDLGRVDEAAFFADAGNWHGGAGIGLRYATGIGPIRLDVAAPLNRGAGTGQRPQLYLGLGQAF